MKEITALLKSRSSLRTFQQLRPSTLSWYPSCSSSFSLSSSSSSRSLLHTSSVVSFQASHWTHYRQRTDVREKARARSIRQAERIQRTREKDGSLPRHPFVKDNDANNEEIDAIHTMFVDSKGKRLNMAEQERLLRKELTQLSTELERIEKKQKSDEIEKQLPPLDDQTLDQLYQALMLPPAPTAEDERLSRIEGGRKALSLGLPKSTGYKTLEIGLTKRDKYLETKELLRQRLIHARERGRALLPPRQPKSTRDLEKQKHQYNKDAEREREEAEEDLHTIDLSQISHQERQQVRLQQLFSRLTLINPSNNQLDTTDGSQQPCLSQMKSNLATRIANILREHQYVLQPEPNTPPPHVTDSALKVEQDENHPPTFEPLHFENMRISNSHVGNQETLEISNPNELNTDSHLPVPSSSLTDDQLIETANEILQDPASSKARTFMLDKIERLIEPPLSVGETPQEPLLPLGIATMEEWTALTVASAKALDDQGLARTFRLMKRSGYFPPPLDLFNQIMDVYAGFGRTDKCQEILSFITQSNLTPDSHTYHCLTKAYLSNGQFDLAIQVLNSLEAKMDQGQAPAGIATYTMVIDKLMDNAQPEIQAVGWNLFYHMRLVAHPIADAPLYARMIRACAKGIPQPQDIDDPTKKVLTPAGVVTRQPADAERALDLFREMTTRYGVRPNAEVYNNVILTCARRKDFYLDGFRLLREMVELETELISAEKSIQGDENGTRIMNKYLRFAPDRYTFNALLQGCAKNKDLPRARWVLAEMIRTTAPLFQEQDRKRLTKSQTIELMIRRPNAETLTHVFWAYASFQPPIKRSQMKSSSSLLSSKVQEPASSSLSNDSEDIRSTVVSDVDSSNDTPNLPLSTTKEKTMVTENQSNQSVETLDSTEAATVFSHMVPQTSFDVIAEVKALFSRILVDQPHSSSSNPSDTNQNDKVGLEDQGPLGNVKPTTMLLNSYLAVFANHLTPCQRLSTLVSSLSTLFPSLSLQPNAYTFRLFLSTACQSDSKIIDHSLANHIWSCFLSFCESHTFSSSSSSSKAEGVGVGRNKQLNPRVIEKCWSERIRYLSKTNQIDLAIQTLESFIQIYPPISPSSSSVKKPLSSSVKKPRLDFSPIPISSTSLSSLSNSSTTTTTMPMRKDEIPPMLTFFDLELLHHRLVRYRRSKDIDFVNWVVKSYKYPILRRFRK